MVTHGYNRAYNELYLNNAMVTLATMLDYAVNFKNEDIDYIFKRFIDSGYAMAFEKGEPYVTTGNSGIELYNRIKGNYLNSNTYYSFSRSPEYWLGWSLAYYQWYTNNSFRNIHRQISLSEMRTWYYTLHEADISRFVDTLNNRLYIKQTNLEYFRKRAGLTQKDLSLLSGVPEHTIQLYEQRQNDISKAQFNILYSLSRVLNCSVYDLAEQNKPINTDSYNLQYSQDNFINQVTNRIEAHNRNIANLQAERAQLALQQQCYALGYAGQFPYQQLHYKNQNYLIHQQTFNNNWNSYWVPIMQQQSQPQDFKEKERQLAKIGLEVISNAAKENNLPAISNAADALSIITADSLAEAIQKAISLIKRT